MRPLTPNPQEANDSFVRKRGWWSEKAMRPSSDTSRQPLSLSLLSEGSSVGMRERTWLSMLRCLREHLRERMETELKRESNAWRREAEISERACKERRCLDLESSSRHRLHTREHVFLSWQPNFFNTYIRHSSGSVCVRSLPLPLPLPLVSSDLLMHFAVSAQQEEA